MAAIRQLKKTAAAMPAAPAVDSAREYAENAFFFYGGFYTLA